MQLDSFAPKLVAAGRDTSEEDALTLKDELEQEGKERRMLGDELIIEVQNSRKERSFEEEKI